MKVIVGAVIEKDGKYLLVQEAKDYFDNNVIVPNDLEEIIID